MIYPKTHLAAVKDPNKLDSIHSNVDWSPVLYDDKKVLPKSYSKGTIQRIENLKELYDLMKDSINGVVYGPSKVSSSKYVQKWFNGIETF